MFDRESYSPQGDIVNERGEVMPEQPVSEQMSDTERLVADLDQKIRDLEARVAEGDASAARKVQELYAQKQHALHN